MTEEIRNNAHIPADMGDPLNPPHCKLAKIGRTGQAVMRHPDRRREVVPFRRLDENYDLIMASLAASLSAVRAPRGYEAIQFGRPCARVLGDHGQSPLESAVLML